MHHGAAKAAGVVLHVDADAFFAQVEAQRDSSLPKAIAVQQHQDIIAVSYAARALGVKKHAIPADIRRKYPTVRIVHVPLTGATRRASYESYRVAGSRVFASICEAVAQYCCRTSTTANIDVEMEPEMEVEVAPIVERASIDEAYIDVTAAATRCTLSAHATSSRASCGDDALLGFGMEVGAALRRHVLRRTGFVCSVGVAENKLLAKLASSRAKPDGLWVLAQSQVPAELRRFPARRLPGCGGRRGASAWEHLGVKTAFDVQRLGAVQLEPFFGAKEAAQVMQYCRGHDDRPVRPRAPQSSMSVQLSLATEPRANLGTRAAKPKNAGARAKYAHGDAASSIKPVPARDSAAIKPFVSDLASDLLGRIEAVGAEAEAAWPRHGGGTVHDGSGGSGGNDTYKPRNPPAPAIKLKLRVGWTFREASGEKSNGSETIVFPVEAQRFVQRQRKAPSAALGTRSSRSAPEISSIGLETGVATPIEKHTKSLCGTEPRAPAVSAIVRDALACLSRQLEQQSKHPRSSVEVGVASTTLLAKLSLGVQGLETFHAYVRAVAQSSDIARTSTYAADTRKRKRAKINTLARNTSQVVHNDGKAVTSEACVKGVGDACEPKMLALQPLLLADFLGDSTRDTAPIVGTELITQLLDARAAQCKLLEAEVNNPVH